MAEDVNGVAVVDVQQRYIPDVSIATTPTLQQRIDLGFANTSGNTETLNFNGKYQLINHTQGYHGEMLHIGVEGGLLVTKDGGSTTNEEYTTTFKLEQEFANAWSLYFRLDWLRNRFKNFNHKIMIGKGVGKEILSGSYGTLKLKLGGAYNIQHYHNTQASDYFGSFTQYLSYQRVFQNQSNFYIKVGASESFEELKDYEIIGVLGVTFQLGEGFHLVVEEEMDYDALPAVGFETHDSKTIVRLGYRF